MISTQSINTDMKNKTLFRKSVKPLPYDIQKRKNSSVIRDVNLPEGLTER